MEMIAMTTTNSTDIKVGKFVTKSPVIAVIVGIMGLGYEALKLWVILNLIISGIHFNSGCNGGFTNVISNEWFCGRPTIEQTETR